MADYSNLIELDTPEVATLGISIVFVFAVVGTALHVSAG